MNQADTPGKGKPDLIAGIVLAASITTAFRIGWIMRNAGFDDALIVLRYVRNILAGQGWVYNVGEPFNACTSALHTMLLVVVGFFCEDLRTAPVWTFTLGLSGASFVAYRLFRDRSRAVAVLAAFLVLTSRLLQLSFGLETTLFVFLALLSLERYQSGHPRTTAAALGLLFLTRPDGLLLAGLLFLHAVLVRREKPATLVQGAAIFLALVLPWLATSYLMFGEVLPSSVGVKLAQGRSGFWGEPGMFWRGLLEWLPNLARRHNPWAAKILLAASFLGVVSSTLRRRAIAGLPLVWTLGYTATYLLLDVPGYHWYYAVLHVGILIFAAAGFEAIWEAANRWLRSKLGLAALWVAAFWVSFQATFPVLLADWQPFIPRYIEAAAWLSNHSAPDASIAAAEVGNLGYFTGDRRIVDIAGLVTPGSRQAVAHGDFTWWFRNQPPDFIVFHEPLWPIEAPVTRLPAFGAAYAQVHRIEGPPGQGLVIYQRRSAASPEDSPSDMNPTDSDEPRPAKGEGARAAASDPSGLHPEKSP